MPSKKIFVRFQKLSYYFLLSAFPCLRSFNKADLFNLIIASYLLHFTSRKNFRVLMQACRFFFSQPFKENFKFLKNCPYYFYKFFHSQYRPKGVPACTKASKSHGWHVRNIAKINPKMANSCHFSTFLIFSKTLRTIRTKFSTVTLHLNMVLCVQFQ